MEFLKWECRVNNVNKNLKVACPKCRCKFFWTRPWRIQFENTGRLYIMCSKCSQLYWAMQAKDRITVYTKMNREEEDFSWVRITSHRQQ